MRVRYIRDTLREYLAPAPERPRTITGNPRTGEGHDGWIIAQVSVSGRPIRWFAYHTNDVWRWVSTGMKAEVFPTREAAEYAAMNCSVYYRDHYRIVKRT